MNGRSEGTTSENGSSVLVKQILVSNIAGLIQKQENVITSLQRQFDRLDQDFCPHPHQYIKEKFTSILQLWELISDLRYYLATLLFSEMSDDPLAYGYNMDRNIEMKE